jgi:catechol 2,3-dioxygenase-like lactoylglutathione lyase family enzyme
MTKQRAILLSAIRGQHLGPNRLAERIAGVGIPMADPAEATAFYLDKLSFARAPHPLESGLESGIAALMLPATPAQRIEFLPPLTGQQTSALPFRLIFSVPDLRRAAGRLQALGLPATKDRSKLVIEDPDGAPVVFIRSARETP